MASGDDGPADDDWFSEAALSEAQERATRARQADPLTCVADLIAEVFDQNTEEEARDLLRSRAAMAPAWAQDTAGCLDAVAQLPVAGLAALLQERAELYLYHDDDEATPYSDAETQAWLRDLAAEVRAAVGAAGA